MGQSILFLSPRMDGKRFSEHSIPLELLRDISVLEDLIIEVAKWCYLQDNPNRQRTPRGFTDGVSIRLAAVKEGSAIPVINLIIENPSLLSEKKLYLDRAKDCVINAINAAEHNELITSFLPDFLLGYFDRIGRGLQEGECIEFSPEDPIKKARLNKSTRRKLLLASKEQEVTEEVTLRGSIPEADQDKMTFELQSLDGSRINAPIDNRYFSTVLEAFREFKSGTLVILKGVARYNRNNNHMEEVESIESINILDRNDITLQLNELRKIQNGWLDGEKGTALDTNILDWFSSFFDLKYPEGELPLPFLYPTPEGGVQAEWSINNNEITLEIQNVKHCKWHSLDMMTERAEEKNLNLNEETDWSWMVSKIREINSKGV